MAEVLAASQDETFYTELFNLTLYSDDFYEEYCDRGLANHDLSGAPFALLYKVFGLPADLYA